MTRRGNNLNGVSAWLLCFITVGQTILLSGCAAPKAGPGSSAAVPSPVGQKESVGRIDFTKAPALNDLEEHVRQFGNEMYPKICALLADDAAKLKRRFDVIIGPTESRNMGETYRERARIYIDSASLTNSLTRLERFDKIFVHEMAHMAQCYDGLFRTRPPVGWEEGIADFVRFKILGTNGWECPECNARYPHYSSGYTCAGAFLLFVEESHGSNIVRQLNAELNRGSYADAFFLKATGESLANLWAEFQKTSAFNPSATEAFKMQQALGFENGRPPKDIETRFEKFVNQNADEVAKQTLKRAATTKEFKSIQDRMAAYLYFKQPGGTADQFLASLLHDGKLPGVAKGEKVWLSSFLSFDDIAHQTFPATKRLLSGKQNDPSKYHYTVVRSSQEAGWKLERAWRTAPDGRVIEEFPLP